MCIEARIITHIHPTTNEVFCRFSRTSAGARQTWYSPHLKQHSDRSQAGCSCKNTNFAVCPTWECGSQNPPSQAPTSCVTWFSSNQIQPCTRLSHGETLPGVLDLTSSNNPRHELPQRIQSLFHFHRCCLVVQSSNIDVAEPTLASMMNSQRPCVSSLWLSRWKFSQACPGDPRALLLRRLALSRLGRILI